MSIDIKALINHQTIPLARNPETGDYEEMVVAPDVLMDSIYPVTLTAVDDAGNIMVLENAADVYVNAIWITPKTDWTCRYDSIGNYIGDYLNKEDWRRIMGNLLYLKALADRMYPMFVLSDMGPLKDYQDYPYAKEWNAVEENIGKIIKQTYEVMSWQRRSFNDNGHLPDYAELNRIESATLRIYEILQGQYDSLKRLSFILGGDEFGN